MKKNKTERYLNNNGNMQTEETTIIVYKGTYTEAELNSYSSRAKANGINFIIAENSNQIINYVNDATPDLSSDWDWAGGDVRGNDEITDFTFVGHGGPDGMYFGYNAGEKGGTNFYDFEDEFTDDCEIKLRSCGSGMEDDGYWGDWDGDLFESAKSQLGTGGKVSGYRTTVEWGENGLGSAAADEHVYQIPSKRTGKRPIQPKNKRIRNETIK